MKSLNRIFWQSLVVVGLLFSHVSCQTSPLTTKRAVAGSEKVVTIDEGTQALVANLRGLGADLKKSIDLKDQQLTNTLVTDIKGVWQRIIDKLKPDLYEDLIFYTARLLFLANDRHCESPYETFFKRQCLPIGDSKHCPENHSLIDGPDNKGFCGSKTRSKVREVELCYRRKRTGVNMIGNMPILPISRKSDNGKSFLVPEPQRMTSNRFCSIKVKYRDDRAPEYRKVTARGNVIGDKVTTLIMKL